MSDTARQRRAQQVEAKYAADLRTLRQAKEDDLQELNERFKVLKRAYRQERINIKEDFALQRLGLKSKIESLKNRRAVARNTMSDLSAAEQRAVLEDFNNSINSLAEQLIKLERQEHAALTDAEERFDNRCKDNQAERRAINKHYINETTRIQEAYLQHVEQNRQEREAEEGGDEV